jgi:uncharacterized protein YgiM (DUF1202 family)
VSKNYNNYYKKHNNEKPKEEISDEEVEVKIDSKEKQKEVEYVTPVEEVKDPPIKEPEKAIVNVDRLNFRAKPSKDGEIFSILNKGKEVDLISETTDVIGWSHVSVDGKHGYVMTEFIDIKR